MAGFGDLTGTMIRRNRRGIPREVHGDGRFVRPRQPFVPAYLGAWEAGRLREKVDEALERLRDCTLCPRDCHVDRLAGRFAVCKTARRARVSAAFPHLGEEDVLRGWNGSGTTFFAWCNLRHRDGVRARACRRAHAARHPLAQRVTPRVIQTIRVPGRGGLGGSARRRPGRPH